MAGTVVATCTNLFDEVGNKIGKEIAAVCTADAADGSFPATELMAQLTSHNITNMFLLGAVAAKGATAPTNASSYTVKDAISHDLMGGRGASVISSSAAATAQSAGYDNTPCAMRVRSNALTLALTGNSVNSATVTVRLLLMYRPF